MKSLGAKKLMIVVWVVLTTLVLSVAGIIVFSISNHNNKSTDQSLAYYEYIESKQDLIDYLQDNFYDYSDSEIRVTTDIDMAGYNWKPAGTMSTPFSGKLIGNKDYEGGIVTIKNLTINLSAQENYTNTGNTSCFGTSATSAVARFDGFFGVVKDATIQNIRFENVTYQFTYDRSKQTFSGTTSCRFGVVCGRTYGQTTIENCEVRGLEISLNYLNGGSGQCFFQYSGLVGITMDVGSGEYSTYNYSQYTQTTGAKTTIKNVIVSGDISVSNNGNNSTSNSAWMRFYGIAIDTMSSTESVIIDTAAFLPNQATFYTQTGRGWSTNWIENSDWYKICSGNSRTTKQNLCTNVSDMQILYNNGVLTYSGHGSDGYFVEEGFFYDSTIAYNTDGIFYSSSNVTSPTVVLAKDCKVYYDLVVIDDDEGVDSISVDKKYFDIYEDWDTDLFRYTPCIMDVTISSSTIKVGDAEVSICLKEGYSTSGWVADKYNDDEYVCYYIEIIPDNVSITFSSVEGTTFDGEASYSVAKGEAVTITTTNFSKQGAYRTISFTFTPAGQTSSVTVTYSITATGKYLSTAQADGVDISSSCTVNKPTTFSVELANKTYNPQFN